MSDYTRNKEFMSYVTESIEHSLKVLDIAERAVHEAHNEIKRLKAYKLDIDAINFVNNFKNH